MAGGTEDRNRLKAQGGFFSVSPGLKKLVWAFVLCIALCSTGLLVWQHQDQAARQDQIREKFGRWDGVRYNLSPEREELLQKHPGVRSAASLVMTPELSDQDIPVGSAAVLDPAFADMANLELLEGSWPVGAEDLVISESLARRLQLNLSENPVLHLQCSGDPDWQKTYEVTGIFRDYGQNWLHYYGLPQIFLAQDPGLPEAVRALYLELEESSELLQRELGLYSSDSLVNIAVVSSDWTDIINRPQLVLLAAFWSGLLLVSTWMLFLWLDRHARQIELLHIQGYDALALRRDLLSLLAKPVLTGLLLSFAVPLLFQAGWKTSLQAVLLTLSASLLLALLVLFRTSRLEKQTGRPAEKSLRAAGDRKRKSRTATPWHFASRLFWHRPAAVLLQSALAGFLLAGALISQSQIGGLDVLQKDLQANPDLVVSVQSSVQDGSYLDKTIPRDTAQAFFQLEGPAEVVGIRSGLLLVRWPGMEEGNLWNSLPKERNALPSYGPVQTVRKEENWIRANVQFADFSKEPAASLAESLDFDPQTEVLAVSELYADELNQQQAMEIRLDENRTVRRRIRAVPSLSQLDPYPWYLNSDAQLKLVLDSSLLEDPEAVNQIALQFREGADPALLKTLAGQISLPQEVSLLDQDAVDAFVLEFNRQKHEISLALWLVLLLFFAVLVLMDTVNSTGRLRQAREKLQRTGASSKALHRILRDLFVQKLLVSSAFLLLFLVLESLVLKAANYVDWFSLQQAVQAILAFSPWLWLTLAACALVLAAGALWQSRAFLQAGNEEVCRKAQ